MFWATQDTAIVYAVLLATIVIALLMQQRSGSRVEATATSSWEASIEIRGVPQNSPNSHRSGVGSDAASGSSLWWSSPGLG